MLYYLDLFAGIGGFALGAAWAGLCVDRHFFSEVDPYAIKVYRKRFPDAEPLGDVCGIRGADLPAGEWILSGGFPCQDISVAGKGAGLEGARSGLWYEYARLIGELRPRYAIMENVGALTGRGLDAVLGGLAEIGYDAEWQDIRASDVGAPHRRERIWIVAYPGSPRRWEDSRGSSCDEITNEGRRAKNDNQPDSHGKGDGARNVADAARELSHGSGGAWGRRAESTDGGAEIPNPEGERRGAGRSGRSPGNSAGETQQAHGTLAHPTHGGDVRRDGELGATQGEVLGPCRSPSHGGREWWAAEPDVGRVAHGIPSRVDRLKGLGNSIVPQIAEMIFRGILEELDGSSD